MAERAKSKAKAAKGKVTSRGTVATLPKKRGSKKAAGVGHNSMHAVPDETIRTNLLALKAKKKAMDKVVADYKEDLDTARGVYRSARKLAKKEGVNLKGFDIMIALESDDLGHVQVNYADVARYQKLTDSPLCQLDMFSAMLTPEPKVDIALQGQQAGKEGVDRGDNPHTPGSDDFLIWEENWQIGQNVLAEGLGRGKDAVSH